MKSFRRSPVLAYPATLTGRASSRRFPVHRKLYPTRPAIFMFGTAEILEYEKSPRTERFPLLPAAEVILMVTGPMLRWLGGRLARWRLTTRTRFGWCW